MLRCLEWIGFLAVPVQESSTRAAGAVLPLLLLGLRVVERNWDRTPVGNEQRTIRLVLVMVVDSSRWNTLPGLRSYREIYVLPRPYGGLGLALMASIGECRPCSDPYHSSPSSSPSGRNTQPSRSSNKSASWLPGPRRYLNPGILPPWSYILCGCGPGPANAAYEVRSS